ncbi:hypothetical protein [Piscinibacter sp.]|uniref:hypothetical protein n=1 Tax=Piscinibacter sp. TaxID=1903157 RepID=UPI002ED0CC5D
MLLIREAVQNSWDARKTEGGQVLFRVDGYALSSEAKHHLLQTVFAEDAPKLALRAKLAEAEQLQVLALSDFGTVGLGGPTRGDVVAAQGEPTHFVDFLRNLGRPPDRVQSGGTYGFGKAAYYLASSLQTICVYSRYQAGGMVRSRFIAAALGDQFEGPGSSGRKHTGRHWWGRLSEDVAEPVAGGEADALNSLLGGPVREGEQTGTTVFILQPWFEPLKPEQAMERLGRVLLHYFWPKLIDGPNGAPSMQFATSWQGDDIPLPSPDQAPGLPLMMRAFRSAVSGTAEQLGRVEDIRSLRPDQQLGRVGFVKTFATGVTPAQGLVEAGEEAEALPAPQLRSPIHHVALMRAPHFVVRYLEGAPLSYDSMDYAGVFIANEDLDPAFANAEPPTHDDWVHDLLADKHERSFVRRSLARVKEAAKAFAAPVSQEAPPYVSASMVDFARLLGGLIPSVEPPGGGDGRQRERDSEERGSRGSRGGGREGRGGAPLQLEFQGRPKLEMYGAVPAMKVSFQISGPAGSTAAVTATTKIVIPDGFETDPPQGASQPVVLAWTATDGTVIQDKGASCKLAVLDQPYTVIVSMPDEAVVSLSLDADDGA